MIRTLPAVAGLIVTAVMSALAAGALHAAEPEAALDFAPGTEVTVACETKAVVVATDAAKASSGPITLQLSAPSSGTTSGLWRITSTGDGHQASFAATQRAVCNDGCPMTVHASGEVHLWAPKPATLDKLADGETLFVAVLKPVSLALRASTFRGKDIEALEEGTCRKVDP